MRISGVAVRCRKAAWRTISPRSSSLITGAGMRAKDENSSTMRPMSPTWRMIVSVQMVKVSGSLLISLRYLRFSRSAESWIGVSGFLISCAMRRATSAQAALRCADSSSVMSSKVTTKPLTSPSTRSAAMRTSSVEAAAVARDAAICDCAEPVRAARRLVDERRHLRHDLGQSPRRSAGRDRCRAAPTPSGSAD